MSTKSKLTFPLLLLVTALIIASCNQPAPAERPNILFCIADDWSWPHAGAYGDKVVRTPAFDQLAREGMLFDNAFVSSPSCTPSRNAILTGQHFWRLEEGANLWSTLDTKFPVYPLLLEDAGYFIGSWRKSWGPGDLSAGGYDSIHPAGKVFPKGFAQFLEARPEDQPFCFWLGASDPHRPYEKGSGKNSGLDINEVEVPGFLPNNETIRSDIADYYFEVERFDSDVARAIQLLDSLGELENTLIVVTGDNGLPFPRCKGNLYESGVHVPLVVAWGDQIQKNTSSDALVSLTDLAPTFLELAGVEIPEIMTGKSLTTILLDDKKANAENFDYVVYGRERHTPAQLVPSMDGYPSRAIRTHKYLYIRNLKPDRWPAGVPENATHPINNFADCDGSPSKTFLMENKDNPAMQAYYDLSFAKRPAEELYDVTSDPWQLVNLANDPLYEAVRDSLSELLTAELEKTNDPRIVDNGVDFDAYPYRSGYELNKADKKR